MESNKKLYTVLLGDLKHSRRIDDRGDFADKFSSYLQQLNSEYETEICAKLAFTKGIDEFSGVLNGPFRSYKICSGINEFIFPEQFRFIIVQGLIDVNPSSSDARIMDGPAFHKAAAKMEIAKKKGMSYIYDLGEKEQVVSTCISEIANLISLIKDSQTNKQHEIGLLLRESKFQKHIAAQLGITQQAVSIAIKASYWKELLRAENTLNQLLEEKNLRLLNIRSK